MKYSFNSDKGGVVFGGEENINASFKDLCAVADSIRYKSVPAATAILEGVSNGGKAIPYRRHNKGMGSRHELGGKKGRYPSKCAKIVQKVFQNAVANANRMGLNTESMFVVHASANKMSIVHRNPSKGALSFGRGMYGYGSIRRSDLELSKVEIAISENASMLGKRASKSIDVQKIRAAKKKTAAPAQPAVKGKAKPKVIE
ncbi:MAG: 50S ribosomal protein L22 [Candidatus Marsarchaeota archaeon]|nr:50S ribosomal protein L22 [Candidatus Marsarchaeota archaeon]